MAAHIIPDTTRVTSYKEIPPNSHFHLHIFFVAAVLQAYEARVNDEFVLRGNTAILKCIVPSFVADFVHVVAWIMDNETVLAEESPNYDSGSARYKNIFTYPFPYPTLRFDFFPLCLVNFIHSCSSKL